MNFKLKFVGFLLCLGSLSAIRAQEVLVPCAPELPAYQSRKSADADTIPKALELPFFDDFSRKGWLPHPEFWIDEYVYINNTYTRNPITIGIATLDAIYSDGQLNGTGSIPFESDFLTSVSINLDYPGRQDIWLSFFYGRRGLGDAPEIQDSLTVEFFEPDSSKWETVWAKPGFTENPAPKEDTLIQAYIQIHEERFLKKGFRFRFKNFASLPSNPDHKDQFGNVDHWNIDYVYLDTARSSNVTALNDVSMISPPGSIFKNYQSLPWSHFNAASNAELLSFIEIKYRNNDTTTRNATRILKITDLYLNHSDSVNGGAVNINPWVLNSHSFPNHYPWGSYDEADSAVFEIMSYLITEDLDIKTNDTVVRYQHFYNYYAYDDGSAENGYGLRGAGTANASVAYRFNSYKKDTLRGIKFYFNRTANDYTQDYFRLAVWDHDDELDGPGELIRNVTGVKPEYQSELNKFTTYAFDTLIVLSDIFYVGWIKTTENMLNVGFDVWDNNQDKIYYNLGQGWVNTAFNGSLMVRPLFGHELAWPVSIPKSPEISELQLHIYPNPATDQFHINLSHDTGPIQNPDPAKWSLSLYNLQGKLVYSSPGSPAGDNITDIPHCIGDLPEGLYIVRVNQDGIYRAGSKLMIVR